MGADMDAAELPALPEGWEWTTLGEVCSSPQYGWTTSGSSAGDLKLLRTTDITKGEINWSSVPYCETNPPDISKYLLSDGDILISRAGSVGYSTLISNPKNAVFASYLIRFKPNEGIIKKYLAFFLQSPIYWTTINENSAGIAIPNVNGSKLKTIPFPLAPWKVQEQTVSIIEELFTQLDAAEEALKRAKTNLLRYRQSVLQAAVTGELTREWREAHAGQIEPASVLLERIRAERRAKWEDDLLARGKDPSKVKYEEPAELDTSTLPELPEGWVWVKLDQISDHRLGKMLDKEKNKGTSRPYLRNANVRWFSFNMDDIHQIRVTDEELDNISAITGDLIVCEGGEPGRCAVWKDSTPVVLQKALHRVRFQYSEIASFLAISLMNDSINGRLDMYFTGSTIKHLTGESLANYCFTFPPNKEQIEIVSKFEEIFSIIKSVNDNIEYEIIEILKLRQAILQQAFCGQLII
jgi:type I restriction enzyme S subunit